MNRENFDRLIAHIEAIEQLIDFGRPSQCFGGMIRHLTGNGENAAYGHEGDIAQFLDIPLQDATLLFYMTQPGEGASSGYKRMDEFGLLPLAKQKVVLIDVLRTYLATSSIDWVKAFTLVRDGAV